jgi:hypothetical protein
MFFINPFIYAGGGDFESIATVTVGSGGAADITFSSIPSTYQHLQLRMICRDVGTSNAGRELGMQFNGSTATNYTTHQLYGDGSGAFAAVVGTSTSDPRNYPAWIPQNGTTSSAFGAVVIDILDYASTSKNTTARSLSGWDANGSGFVLLRSGLWRLTDAVSSIKVFPNVANFAQYSTAALYGVKAP